MKNILLVLLFCFTVNSFAADCRNFDKNVFTGVFKIVEYRCLGEDQIDYSCYSETDTYQNISEVFITTVPLQVELGLELKFFSHVDPTWPELIDQYTFSEASRYSRAVLTCKEVMEDGEKIIEMKSELSSGASVFNITITKRGELIEIKNFASLNGISGSRLLILEN
jgi:hypothetical protein